MANRADFLMVSGIAAFCADCGDERIFVPVEDGCDPGGWVRAGCASCCTTCDAAVFLVEVLDNTSAPHRQLA